MAQLGGAPVLIGAVGEDFDDYRGWLERHGVDCRFVHVSEHPAHRAVRVHDRRGDVPDRLVLRRRDGRGAPHRAEAGVGRRPAPTWPSSAPTTRTRWCSTAPSAATAVTAFAADPSQQIARMNGEQMIGLIEGADLLFTNEYEKNLLESKTGRSDADMLAMVNVRVTTLGSDGVEITGRDVEPVHGAGGQGAREGRPDRRRRRLPGRPAHRARLGPVVGARGPGRQPARRPSSSRPSARRSTRSSRSSSPTGSPSPTATSAPPRSCRYLDE